MSTATSMRDRAGLDHHDAVGEDHRLRHVMGDEDRGEPVLHPGPMQQVLHLEPRQGVEGAERLVEHQHAGPADQRARQRDTALLAARQSLGPFAGA